ncbi:amino acid ABC transporter permease [Angustibacter sp. McL0619]|uniref:amino acid ABC transporter permease n=1 Tax=Angustibacter sp. McL0619 TaxID=3415676 RepID=UPI003CE8B23C
MSTYAPSARQVERLAYRQRRAVRSAVIGLVSTLVVVTVVLTVLVNSPGWPRVKASFFDWDVAKASLPDILVGLWLNVRIMVVCAVFILIFGMALAIMRTLRGPVFFPMRAFATAYVDLFRGMPLLLVLLLVGFGVPGLRLQGLPSSVLFYGCVALVLTYSSYVAEVFRAGIESVHPSQLAAARGLGLSYPQTMRYVVVPQAVRRVVPPLLNDLVSLQKDSGLISILGVIDAIRAAQIAQAEYASFTPYVVAGICFVLLTIPLTRLTDRVARKQGWQGAGGVP